MRIACFFSAALFLLLLVSCKPTTEQLIDQAYSYYQKDQYKDVVITCDKVIRENSRLQRAYYYRGFGYMGLKQYDKALADFNQILAMNNSGGAIITMNPDFPFASEETRMSIPYYTALYERALAYYYMDSLKQSFADFQDLVNVGYEDKSNCMLWQGTIWLRYGKNDKACALFRNAKLVAATEDDRKEADSMLVSYCGRPAPVK